MTPEDLMAMQGQLMQTMMQFMQTQQANQAGGGQPHVPPRDKHGDFMKGHPPYFSHAEDPLEADDWLRTIERQLNICQCDDQQMVLYVAGQLQGAALDWWESYLFARPHNAPPVTW